MNHLNDTIPLFEDSVSKETIIHYNQYAAEALDHFGHKPGENFIFEHNKEKTELALDYDISFPRNLMKERNDLAEFGALALCFFQMSNLLGYQYVELSVIGTGVDYFFSKEEDDENEENFLANGVYVEVSGIMSEKEKINYRIRKKHGQIKKGSLNRPNSSVCITSFPELRTVNQAKDEF